MPLHKKSRDEVERNGPMWLKNLPVPLRRYQRRHDIDLVDKPFADFVRLPSRSHILGRFLCLYDERKEINGRIKVIGNDLLELWSKFSFPTLSTQTIMSKIHRLVNDYNRHKKRNDEKFQNELNSIFDITKVDGLWLCKEDKELYRKQIESEGKVGYRTDKIAALTSIHPSKRKYLKTLDYTQHDENESVTSTDTANASDKYSTDVSSEISETYPKRRCSTESAGKLVKTLGLSTWKAFHVCKSLDSSNVEIPTPCQSGIWRRSIRDGLDMEETIKKVLFKEKNYSLHFDGARMDDHEYQVVCMQSYERQIKLGIIRCASGSSLHIYEGIKGLLDEYVAWSSIKMIICDTTPVNTGRLNGVVVQIQKEMAKKGFLVPQYIGCQHHILDRLLKHVFDYFIENKPRKPSFNYAFIEELTPRYVERQSSYSGEVVIENIKNPGWRDDYKFLFELCSAYRFYKANKKFPIIKWRKLPSLHAARWNSRAIYSLVSYFLLPHWRTNLHVVVDFVAHDWQEAWFSKHTYDEKIYTSLSTAISRLKCPPALKCFNTHWSREKSVIDLPRSNIIAERAVKLMKEMYPYSKRDEYLNLKFIATNTL